MNLIVDVLKEILFAVVFAAGCFIFSGVLIGIIKTILKRYFKLSRKSKITAKKCKRINNVVYNIDLRNKTLQEIQVERKAMFEMLKNY